MRRFLSMFVACILMTLAGCCGEPSLTVRSPISFGMEPMRVQGPSGIAVPQVMYPQFQAAPGGCSCAPGLGGWFGAGYSVPQFQAPAAAAPCATPK